MNDEDIKTIEELIDKCKNCTLQECINCEINYNQVQAIENLLKENKELKSKLIIAKGGSDYWCQKYCEVSNNSVPVAKIKEKIEDLKSYKGLVMYEKYNYEAIIRHLQELLEVK